MAAPIITDEHMDRAYAQLKKHGWPTLQVLHDHYCLYGILRARAVSIANGVPVPADRVMPAAAPATAAAPTPAHPNRRRADPVPAPHPTDLFDPRMAAAGEYSHPEE